MSRVIKAFEINTSILFSLRYAKNTTLSCFFVNYWIIIFNSDRYQKIFNPTAELAIPKRMPTKEAKGEIETQPVKVLYDSFYNR